MKNVEDMTIEEKAEFVQGYVSKVIGNLDIPNPAESVKIFEKTVNEALEGYKKMGVLDNFEIERVKDGLIAHVTWDIPSRHILSFFIEPDPLPPMQVLTFHVEEKK